MTTDVNGELDPNLEVDPSVSLEWDPNPGETLDTVEALIGLSKAHSGYTILEDDSQAIETGDIKDFVTDSARKGWVDLLGEVTSNSMILRDYGFRVDPSYEYSTMNNPFPSTIDMGKLEDAETGGHTREEITDMVNYHINVMSAIARSAKDDNWHDYADYAQELLGKHRELMRSEGLRIGDMVGDVDKDIADKLTKIVDSLALIIMPASVLHSVRDRGFYEGLGVVVPAMLKGDINEDDVVLQDSEHDSNRLTITGVSSTDSPQLSLARSNLAEINSRADERMEFIKHIIDQQNADHARIALSYASRIKAETLINSLLNVFVSVDIMDDSKRVRNSLRTIVAYAERGEDLSDEELFSLARERIAHIESLFNYSPEIDEGLSEEERLGLESELGDLESRLVPSNSWTKSHPEGKLLARRIVDSNDGDIRISDTLRFPVAGLILKIAEAKDQQEANDSIGGLIWAGSEADRITDQIGGKSALSSTAEWLIKKHGVLANLAINHPQARKAGEYMRGYLEPSVSEPEDEAEQDHEDDQSAAAEDALGRMAAVDERIKQLNIVAFPRDKGHDVFRKDVMRDVRNMARVAEVRGIKVLPERIEELLDVTDVIAGLLGSEAVDFVKLRSEDLNAGDSYYALIIDMPGGGKIVIAENPVHGQATYVINESVIGDRWEEAILMDKNSARTLGAQRIIHATGVSAAHHTDKILDVITEALAAQDASVLVQS